jgi:hypothetical protein
MRTEDWTAIDIKADPRKEILRGVTMHGGIQFAVPFVSEIKGNLWTGGCADGLVLPPFFQHVVSLYPWESYSIKHHGLKTKLEVYMYDAIDQDLSTLDSIVAWARHCIADGPTLIHCQAGLNRSALVAGKVLVADGMTGEDAVALIRDKRSPACLCNPAFEAALLDNDE